MNPPPVQGLAPKLDSSVEALEWLRQQSVAGVEVATAAEGGDEFLVVPKDFRVESLKHLVPPKRIEQKVNLTDVDSLILYVNRFKLEEQTTIFSQLRVNGCRLEAVMDYHEGNGSDNPFYCAHRAVFETVETPEWKTWCAANRKPMTQVEFATWLEDNLSLFVKPPDDASDAPTGAELLELVKSLSGKSDVRFSSAVRLESGGNRLHYDEDVELRGQSSTQGGDIVVPKNLVAAIKPFFGADWFAVRARLKYRIESRKLTLWFETVEPHKIIQDSVKLIVEKVEKETELKPLAGSIP